MSSASKQTQSVWKSRQKFVSFKEVRTRSRSASSKEVSEEVLEKKGRPVRV